MISIRSRLKIKRGFSLLVMEIKRKSSFEMYKKSKIRVSQISFLMNIILNDDMNELTGGQAKNLLLITRYFNEMEVFFKLHLESDYAQDILIKQEKSFENIFNMLVNSRKRTFQERYDWITYATLSVIESNEQKL